MFGDNTTITFGANNEVAVTTTNVKTVEQLYQELQKAGIPQSEIADLAKAINKDGGKPSMGGDAGKWYTQLLTKIGKGALKVGMNVATTTIIDLLTKAGIAP